MAKQVHEYKFKDGQVIKWTGKSRCLCTKCRILFGSTSAFAKHIKKGVHYPPHEVGLAQDAQGYYVSDSPHPKAKPSKRKGLRGLRQRARERALSAAAQAGKEAEETEAKAKKRKR